MIFLRLFLVFLEIGAVSFGGGYGMIPLMKELTVSSGWLGEAEFLDIVAVAESTPGPIAVNLATFVGSKQGGIPGAVCATLGVILPSFVIILIISALIRGLMKYKGVQAFLNGVRPCVAGLVIATAAVLFLNVLFGIKNAFAVPAPDLKAVIIFALLGAAAVISRKCFKKKVSPVIMISVSAVLGAALYSLPDF